jgi:uncharacterized SAM-binding protein YcdF (DUF218 family)
MAGRLHAFRQLVQRLVSAFAVLGLLWLGGLIWFATTIPDHVADRESQTDAIVVLTGGSERLDTGLGLLAAGKAKKLFVSGVHRSVEMAELLKTSKMDRERLECCVVLGYSADSTIGNAAETAAWMNAEGYRSLRLVTAAYHMRRSLMELGHAMPDTIILAHPVFPDTVKQADWWRWPGTASLIATEYTKFLLATLRHWAEP